MATISSFSKTTIFFIFFLPLLWLHYFRTKKINSTLLKLSFHEPDPHRFLPKISVGVPNVQAPQSRPSSSLSFSYDIDDPIGPQNWHDVDISENEWLRFKGKRQIDLHRTNINQCNVNRITSPINLMYPDEECGATHEIKTKLHPNIQCSIRDFSFSITSSGLRAEVPSNNDDTCIRPVIDLPNGFPFPWVLAWIEIKARSEHLIEGRRYDGEMLMVHLGKNQHKNQVTIVSVMLDSTTSYYESNDRIEAYLNRWEGVYYTIAQRCEKSVDKINSNVEYPKERDPIRPFPYDIWPTDQFYRYRGSITTPPCTAMVNWRVLDEPIKISRHQFKRIASLINNAMDPKTCQYISAASSKGEVNRPLQQFDYNHQDLNHCTKDYF